MLSTFLGLFTAFVATVAFVRRTKPRGGWTQELKDKCDIFFVVLCSDKPSNKELRTHIAGIMKDLGCNNEYIAKTIKSFARTYQKVSAFLRTRITFVERTQVGQVMEQKQITILFGDYLGEIKGKNVHQDVVNGEGRICSCSYHEEELFYHLLIAGLHSGLHAKSVGTNVFQAIIAAMLHDIGKVSTVSTTEAGYVAYPFHGEMSALILSGIYSEDLAPYFSKEAWETMLRTISIHMCSYHITNFDSYWDKKRVNSTRIESNATKVLLNSLSYGDTLSAFSNLNDIESWLASRDKWWELINLPFKAPEKKSKLLVVVRGFSNSGKSTIAEIVSKDLAKNGVSSTIISRDMVMAQNGGYTGNTRPTGKEYQRLHATCSDEKGGKAVNAEMRKQIRTALKSNTVVIVDTVASMFPGFESGILPACVRNCEVIAIDVNANVMSNTEALAKNGLDPQVQMALSGIRARFAPIDTKKIDLHNMASKYNFANGPAWTSNPSFVYQVGWNESFNGENSIGLIPVLVAVRDLAFSLRFRKMIDGTDAMNIVDYTNMVFQMCDRSYTGLVNHFKMLGYQAGTPSQLVGTKYAQKFINIKYLEHNNNWCIWGRESRGTTLYLNSKTGSWELWKFLMLRGAEMLTTLHKKNGINSNENVSEGKIDHLSQVQQELYKELANPNGTPQLVSSFKKDGSLFSVALYTGKRAKVMRDVINSVCKSSGDTFNKTVMDTYDATVGHKKSVLVFQTQGTLMMTKEMYDYTTTALFDRLDGFDPKLSPEDKIVAYGHQFFTQINNLFDSLPAKGHIMQILFETICANRTESFSGKVHTELAVSYDTSSYSVISATVIHSGKTSPQGSYYTVFPHFQISSQIHDAGFDEPAFWNVTTSAQMTEMLASLDEVTWGRMTVDDFFGKYPPANQHANYEKIVDPEGFVIYDVLRGLSYGKIKSVLYYISHKFREENVKILLDLITANPNCAFPLAVIIRDTIAPMDKILQEVNGKLIAVIEQLLSELQHTIPSRILAAYHREKKVQILLGNDFFKQCFLEKAMSIFIEAFPKLIQSIPSLMVQEIETIQTAKKDNKLSKVRTPTKTLLENYICSFAINGGCSPDPLDFQGKLQKWLSEFVALLVQ